MIQGKYLRLILKEGEDHRQLLQALDLPEAELDEADPRFEDAFIDLLGGGPNHRSALAEIMPTVNGESGETVIEAVQLTKNSATSPLPITLISRCGAAKFSACSGRTAPASPPPLK